MKIQCLFVFLCLASLTQGASSSIQEHAFMSHKALVNLHDENAHVAMDDLDTHQRQPGVDTSEKKNTSTLWTGTSNINVEFTMVIATVWVLVLGSAPILIHRLGEKRVTMSAITISCLMWLALFGGLYLFTNIILFNSPHFDQVRSLTVIECTYFMTQVITTVGYGDITPAKPRGQVFVGVYVSLSFFVIALLMSEMQAVVMKKVNKYKEELQLRRGYTLSQSSSTMAFKPEKPSPQDLLTAIGIFALVATIWVFFFHFYPGEDKSWLEAIYMSLITLTTVGFGAITPVTEGGMLFGAFFMFIGTSALVNVVQSFSTYILEMDQYECWNPTECEQSLKKFGEKFASGGRLTEEHFILLTLLQRKLVTEENLDQIKEQYSSMSASKKPGKRLTLSNIALNISSEINREGLGDSDTEAGSSRVASAR